MEVSYLLSNQAHLFYILHKANDKTNVILYIAPFAEESNKSRAMISQTAKALTEVNQNVLMLDLYACGDSEGDLQQARWEFWLQNINDAVIWLQQQGYQTISLWGLRLGCLLISDYLAQTTQQFKTLLFWQPILKGKRFLTQFLRLRVAAGMTSKTTETVKELRLKLAEKETLEVAGYLLPFALAEKMENATLTSLDLTKIEALYWFEVQASEQPELLPPSQKLMTTWQAQTSIPIKAESLQGDAFWLTQEISTAPQLTIQSLSCFK